VSTPADDADVFLFAIEADPYDVRLRENTTEVPAYVGVSYDRTASDVLLVDDSADRTSSTSRTSSAGVEQTAGPNRIITFARPALEVSADVDVDASTRTALRRTLLEVVVDVDLAATRTATVQRTALASTSTLDQAIAEFIAGAPALPRFAAAPFVRISTMRRAPSSGHARFVRPRVF